MSPRLFSITLILLTACSLPAIVAGDDLFPQQEPKEPSVSVVCHGRLRDGVIAIGSETTGTTITFNRVTWELQLPDDASRALAARYHKASVVVTGTLRRVVGIENAVRWIVDVDKLTARDSRHAVEEGANVTLRGTLRAALSQTSDTANLSVRADDQIWRLDFAADRDAQATAESLIGQPILITGSVLPLPEDSERNAIRSPRVETHTLRVKTVAASAIAAGDKLYFQ
jgi:hypothetical protein